MSKDEPKPLTLAHRLIQFSTAIQADGPRSKLYRVEVTPMAAMALTGDGTYASVPYIPTHQGVHDCGSIYGVGLTVRVDKCDKRVTHPVYPERILFCDRPAMHEGDHHFDCSFSVS